jgi:SRSO17 transposase
MDAHRIRGLRPLLETYLHEFDDCFARSEPTQHLRTYVTGQLSDLQRKSMEPIADAAGGSPRNLQHFLALHAWDEIRMRRRLHQRIARRHRHPGSIGVLDETAHPKKGQKTPGVQRQWCGATGKVDNCVVTVHLNYTAGDFHCLLDGEVFLPESWAEDRDRCRRAKIPEDMTHRPKWRIGLELWERAVANGIRFEWLTFDEHYGEVPQFLFALDDRGQRYVGEIPPDFTGWLVEPALLHKEHHSRRRRPRRRFPRVKAKSPSASRVRNLLRHSPVLRKIPWETFHIKDTTKGPMLWQAKAVAFYLKRDGLPTWRHWLIVARNLENPKEIKYFVSNAPEGTPLEVLLHVAFSRWHVERCFEEEKGELGFSHFEVRNYVSLRRHLILTAVSHLFLAEVHQTWRGEKPATDGLPTSDGLLGTDPIAVAHRAGPLEAARTHRCHHHPDARTAGGVSTQPREKQTPATA